MRRRNEARARLAIWRRDADMSAMTKVRTGLWIAALMAALGGPAAAQLIIPGAAPSVITPPPPPPSPPPPTITVPVVPQFDAPLQSPKAQLQQRGHFSDRIARCLDDGAAMGLNASDRAAYSRGCANQ
jgi:hypothetical protein